MVVPGSERIECAARPRDQLAQQRFETLRAEHEFLHRKLAVRRSRQCPDNVEMPGYVAVAAEDDPAGLGAWPQGNLLPNGTVDLGADANFAPASGGYDARPDFALGPRLAHAVCADTAEKQ